MLETIIILLIVLWVLGVVNSYTIGGLIHLLLVVAIVVTLLRIIQGRRL
ncbi:MAG: lmo0937 family membrane protein [Campylobacterales bacterium]|nr:lmo0937 family membrane protein [Campylobacterales bacterium]